MTDDQTPTAEPVPFNLDPEEVHLVPAPEHGPLCHIDAMAEARGTRSTIYALREGQSFAEFEAERDAPEPPPPPGRLEEVDPQAARLRALETRIAAVEDRSFGSRLRRLFARRSTGG